MLDKLPRLHLVVRNPPAKAGGLSLRFDPWVRKIPWRKSQQSTPVLPRESKDWGAWRVTVQRVTKSQTQLKQLSMHKFLIWG